MKTVAILFMMQAVIFSGNVNGQEVTKPKKHDVPLTLKIEMSERFSLGREIPFSILLRSKKTQEVYSLGTAGIKFVLKQYSLEKQKTAEYEAYTGGKTRTVVKPMPGGVPIVVTVGVKQSKVALNAGEKTERSFDLSTVFNRYLGPGDYVLSAIYEDKLKADTTFKIIIYYRESIPALIELIEEGDFETRVWARNSLFIITGQPEWSPSEKDDAEKLKAEVNDLRSWWLEHKELIELINGILVPEKGRYPTHPRTED